MLVSDVEIRPTEFLLNSLFKKERRGRKKRERREVSSGGSGGEVDEGESRNRREGRKSKKMRFDHSDFELSAKQKSKGFHL